MPATRRRVGLFVTCLVDLFRPTVGFAAAALLERAGCEVVVPAAQTCCGQPAYNSGARAHAKAVARAAVAAFEPFAATVAPSGSCAGMIRRPLLRALRRRAGLGRTGGTPRCAPFELVSFLTDECASRVGAARHEGTVAYHDSCSGLRELGVRAQPRRLLATVEGLRLAELAAPDVCCGFGGTFCVKYPDARRAWRPTRPPTSAPPAPEPCSPVISAASSHRRPPVARGRAGAGAPRGRGAGRPGRPPGHRRTGARSAERPLSGRRAVDATSRAFVANARAGLGDAALQRSLARFQGGFTVKRREAAARLPEFEALRDRARTIKDHTLAALDHYLERFEEKVAESGGAVHWCRTPAEARAEILALCRAAGAAGRSPRASP